MPAVKYTLLIFRDPTPWMIAEEPCSGREDVPRALAELKARWADWWKDINHPGPPRIEFGTTDGKNFAKVETITEAE